MTRWVIDGSLALACALPDEASEAAIRFMRGLRADEPLAVPMLWWSEIANALICAERSRRISESDAARILELYRAMPIRAYADDGADAAWRWIAVARKHGLTAYDAAYLELAQRLGAGLATLDSGLAAAARAAGVKTAPE